MKQEITIPCRICRAESKRVYGKYAVTSASEPYECTKCGNVTWATLTGLGGAREEEEEIK